MKTYKIDYKISSARQDDIFYHLIACKNSFMPPLDQRVDIAQYAHKLNEKSVTFEAWSKEQLVGLIAVYLNNNENGSGFISSVSILDEYKRQGISTELLIQCIRYARQQNFTELSLEVSVENMPALQLYISFGFAIVEKRDNFLTMKLEISASHNQNKTV